MMEHSLKRRGILETAVSYVALVLACGAMALPFFWLLSTSLKTVQETMVYPPHWLPHPPIYGTYLDVLRNPRAQFILWTRNTLIIAVLTVAGVTISSSIVAYGFARIKFRGRGFLFALMLSTMMIPFPVMMVPLYTIFRWLGDHTGIQWLGTFRPLWVPAWFGSAFSIFLLRQFFVTIPEELSEAARIDGCNEWGIYWHIILPLSRPALSVVALFTFMYVWRDFLGPLVYLQRSSQFTLTLGLQAFQSQNGGTPWNLLMAASLLVIAPVILLFFLAQRTFIEGIATTGMKG
jgi:multiple sugar transport system permease protein